VMEGLGIPGVDPVRSLILATQTHANPTGSDDCQLLLDADLAILGAPPDEYDRYAVAIRMEYAWVSEEEYVQGRSQVLRTFLDRESIYGMTPLCDRLEASARRNLTRELAALKS
jgi:predicted metal-dependent HD superfamily phosphohydrolase